MFPDQGTKAFRAISFCFNIFESTRIIKLADFVIRDNFSKRKFPCKIEFRARISRSVYFPFPPLLSREFYSYKENWARVG